MNHATPATSVIETADPIGLATTASTSTISPNSTRSSKDYVNALFGELLLIMRNDIHTLPSTVTDRELKSIINWYGYRIHSKLMVSLMSAPWIDDVNSWIRGQDKSRAEQLIGMLCLVQSFKHHKIVEQLQRSADLAIKKILSDMLIAIDRKNIPFVKWKTIDILFDHFLQYIDGTTSIESIESCLRLKGAYSVDSFLAAIEDVKMNGNNLSVKLDNLKYNLWIWISIYRDTLTRRF